MLSLKKAGVSGIEDHMRPKSVLKLTGLSGARVPMGEKNCLYSLDLFPFQPLLLSLGSHRLQILKLALPWSRSFLGKSRDQGSRVLSPGLTLPEKTLLLGSSAARGSPSAPNTPSLSWLTTSPKAPKTFGSHSSGATLGIRTKHLKSM